MGWPARRANSLSQYIRYCHGDGASCASVGVSVPRQTPGWVNLDHKVRETCIVENPATQHLLRRIFLAELQHDNERRRSMCARQLTGGLKHLTGHVDTALDRRVCAVRNKQFSERSQPRAVLSRKPDETWREMRSILIQIPAKERRHEKRNHGHRSAKMWELRLKSQVRLVVAISMDGQIRSLHPPDRAYLRRNAFLPREPLAEHHRLTGEQDGRLRRIHRFRDAVDAISCRVDGVVDDAPADGLVSGPRWRPNPAKTGIGDTARLFIGREPFGWADMNITQHQFTGAQRQNYSDDDAKRTYGSSRGEAGSTGPSNEQEQRA